LQLSRWIGDSGSIWDGALAGRALCARCLYGTGSAHPSFCNPHPWRIRGRRDRRRSRSPSARFIPAGEQCHRHRRVYRDAPALPRHSAGRLRIALRVAGLVHVAAVLLENIWSFSGPMPDSIRLFEPLSLTFSLAVLGEVVSNIFEREETLI